MPPDPTGPGAGAASAPTAAPVAGPDGNIVGLLLAGGQSRRMGGGDKCLRPLAGQPILNRILDRIGPQVARLLLNANGDPRRFHPYFDGDQTVPVAPDVIEGFAGPLAGVLTGLDWTAAAAPDCPWVVSVATDAPFLPLDLVERLAAPIRNGDADLACATSGGRAHPVIGLWPVALADDLRRAMVEEDIRKVDVWTARYRLVAVPFEPRPDGVDPFFNTNRPEDLAEAEHILATEA